MGVTAFLQGNNPAPSDVSAKASRMQNGLLLPPSLALLRFHALKLSHHFAVLLPLPACTLQIRRH
ncbi:hypothetical protein Mnod_5647 [Methylobacterium nodulans ORS 2060]|uniref:Uncharacterized protein n=1 Tax=Methylobacterium nodulans (strain LMG 21967 / CNCM I-2342 / ORS 2060) TaxID=460265 RepID=B8IQH5_METNO|nr:hypothetical protein Mnod_5647 [Methylobacterium nodulans ORS 2060]